MSAQLSDFIDSITKAIDGASSRTGGRAGLAGALALALGTTYFALPSFDRKTLPEVKRAPKLLKGKEGEPYPDDLYLNGSGKYVNTPLGRIRYYELGPEDPSKGHILLIHGITTPQPWRTLAPALANAGYRVLTFDLPGRGASDSPQIPHDVQLYMSVITYLLTALPSWPTKFHILGMSLGGGIAANFAYYFPGRVDKLILMCPAGMTPKSSVRWGARLFGSGYLAMPLMEAAAKTLPLGLPLSNANPLVAWQANNHPGFFFSFLSSYAVGPIFDQADVYKKVIRGASPGKVSVIWGDADTVVPMASLEHLGDEAEQLKKHTTVIPNGDHFFVVTRPKEAVDAVLDHLAS